MSLLLRRRARCACLVVVTGFLSTLIAPSLALGEGPGLNPRAFAETGDQTDRLPEQPAVTGPVVLNPTYIFEGPVDPETIRQRLGYPDLVILKGDEYLRLRAAAGTQETPPGPRLRSSSQSTFRDGFSTDGPISRWFMK